MLLQALPPEIILQILSFLPVSSLPSLNSISRSWAHLFLENETTIFRQAAFAQGFISNPSVPFERECLRSRYSDRVIEDTKGWKDLCKTRSLIDKAWRGYGPSESIAHPYLDLAGTPLVHRIKVDEKRGLIMTSTRGGGIYVSDMHTGQPLWCQPRPALAFAHLEYSDGYLIYNRHTGDKEIWRLRDSDRSTDHPDDFDHLSDIDGLMTYYSHVGIRNAMARQELDEDSEGQLRGVFEPYALLSMPEPSRAFRFVYPTLLIAGFDKLYLWDVRTANVVEIVENVQNAIPPIPQSDTMSISSPEQTIYEQSLSDEESQPLLSETQNEGDDEEEEEVEDVLDEDMDDDDIEDDTLRYVDHSSSHVFFVKTWLLKVFARATNPLADRTGPEPTRSSIPVLVLSAKARRYRWQYSIKPRSGVQDVEGRSVLIRHELEVTEKERTSQKKLFDMFTSAHVSPCGNHLAVLTKSSRLLIVPHFTQVAGQSQEGLFGAILDIQIGSPHRRGTYLAYESAEGGRGRIGVAAGGGVFILTIPELFYPSILPPKIEICRVKQFMHSHFLNKITCLMMSDTGLFINWRTNPEDEAEDPTDTSSPDWWEEKLEEELEKMQRLGDDIYTRTRNGMLLPASTRVGLQGPHDQHVRSHSSVVHAIHMWPDKS